MHPLIEFAPLKGEMHPLINGGAPPLGFSIKICVALHRRAIRTPCGDGEILIADFGIVLLCPLPRG